MQHYLSRIEAVAQPDRFIICGRASVSFEKWVPMMKPLPGATPVLQAQQGLTAAVEGAAVGHEQRERTHGAVLAHEPRAVCGDARSVAWRVQSAASRGGSRAAARRVGRSGEARERTARVDRDSVERGMEGGDTWRREEEADSRESDRPGRGGEDPAESRGGDCEKKTEVPC